ncbi:hypothetical protein [Nostoc cycadae]|uniref:GRAM domain-containing protein 3, partial n=1 Tax=Nostoc cycadae WK-1 TaxID=1861711 RepID=A0A2H6LR53_9NOSO|nr:hypothetical protein [Nostoc cycadae]GBE95664.1 GRAM domain-containing protein 3 [Nostoc cycadae WK-1]
MTKKIELYDFVRPRTETDSVWRVIDIKPDGQIVAQKRYNTLEPKQINQVVSKADFFELLNEAEIDE